GPTQASTHGPCDTTPPGVSGLKVANGKNVSYSLTEAATVSLKVEKKSKGRKSGKKCVKQTKQNKTKKSCPLFKQVASFSGPGAAGANKASIPKKLGPGTYRLTLTARDAVGNTTTTTTTFKVAGNKKGKNAKSAPPSPRGTGEAPVSRWPSSTASPTPGVPGGRFSSRWKRAMRSWR